MKLGFLQFWWLSSSLNLESTSFILIVSYRAKVWILDHCDILPIKLQVCKFRLSPFSYACHHHFLDFFAKARIQRCGFYGDPWVHSHVFISWVKITQRHYLTRLDLWLFEIQEWIVVQKLNLWARHCCFLNA